jgi:hypothetical protein
MTAIAAQEYFFTPDSLVEMNASLLISSGELNDRSLKLRMPGQGTLRVNTTGSSPEAN